MPVCNCSCEARRQPRCQTPHGLVQSECGLDRTAPGVFVRHRVAEHGQQSVALHTHDRATPTRHGLLVGNAQRRQQRRVLLGLHRAGQFSRTRQIREQQSDVVTTALHSRIHSGCGCGRWHRAAHRSPATFQRIGHVGMGVVAPTQMMTQGPWRASAGTCGRHGPAAPSGGATCSSGLRSAFTAQRHAIAAATITSTAPDRIADEYIGSAAGFDQRAEQRRRGETADAGADRVEDRDRERAHLEREHLAHRQVGRTRRRRGEEEHRRPRQRLRGRVEHARRRSPSR